MAVLGSGPCPRGEFARECYLDLRRQGWQVSRRGWPDLFAWSNRTGDLMVVQVKPSRGRRLKRHQRLVLDALAAYGVPCYQWSPESGYKQIGAANPRAPRPGKKK